MMSRKGCCCSSLEVMKAWMRVSAAEKESKGRRRAMFLRWKKAVWVRRLVCCSNERLLSRIIPRLQVGGEGDRVVLSMISTHR